MKGDLQELLRERKAPAIFWEQGDKQKGGKEKNGGEMGEKKRVSLRDDGVYLNCVYLINHRLQSRHLQINSNFQPTYVIPLQYLQYNCRLSPLASAPRKHQNIRSNISNNRNTFALTSRLQLHPSTRSRGNTLVTQWHAHAHHAISIHSWEYPIAEPAFFFVFFGLISSSYSHMAWVD